MNGNRSAMCLYHPVSDRASQSTATGCTRPCWISAVEAFEDMRRIFCGNADPRVANYETCGSTTHLDAQCDRATHIGVGERVIHQPHHHLNETRRITQHGDPRQLKPQAY